MVGPNRGGVFWLEMEAEGRHPVCVLTRDEAIPSLDNVVVATVSSHIWGLRSEVLLGPQDGMPRECAISLDNLRTVPKALLVEPITKLGAERIDEVCRALVAVGVGPSVDGGSCGGFDAGGGGVASLVVAS